MPLHGFSWFLCCKQGFSLLGLDYEEKEEEESLEMRIKKQETCNGQGLLDVTLSQPTHTVNGPSSLTDVPEEMRNLITEKSNMCPKEDPDVVVKGWLYREVQGGWIQQRRHWFVLSQDSLDYYSSHEKSSRRLGSLVLTSLCSVIWPDKLAYRETGYWNITVYGRKHCYQLYTKHFNEAVHWACAIQKVIDSKAPVETPTQLLIRDIEENRFNPEEVEQIYHHNPILRYTKGPLYASLLPFTYGSLDLSYYSGKGYTTLRDEAVKVFNSLQQLETAQDPVPLIQGVLQTCLDICPLRDEVYCQLVKQTVGTPTPETSGHLRYWQLLTCMSCTFLPGMPVLNYLHFHINRVQSQSPPDTEKVRYATFISDALKKTWCRECVPSWEEIRVLMRRQEMQCTVHYPGPGSCQLPISSHTTANELVKQLQKLLGLQASRNTFALFEQSAQGERAIGGNTIVADVLTSLSTQEAESGSKGRLCFKLYCFLDIDSISVDSTEHMFLFEQCHEMLVRGQLPASEEDLQALAALRLQSLIGDYSTHSPCPPLDELFPGHVLKARVLLPFRIIQSPLSATAYSQAPPLGCSQRFPGNLLTGAMWSHTAANKQKAEQDQLFKCRLKEEEALVMGDIVERWKGLAGFNRHNSMTAYLTIVRRWPGFGCTLYEVDFYISSTGSSAQKLWLGVAAKSLSLYKQGEPEALEFFPYIQIRSYGVTDSNKFKVTTGEQDLFFETSKMTEIMQLMNAYFSARQQEKGQETGMETEGGFCHTPAVLELPQHLV